MIRADVGEPSPAFGTQTRAVVAAHRRERQCEHYRVTKQRLQIDVIVDQAPDLIVVRLVLMPGIDEQLHDVDREFVGQRFKAACALPGQFDLGGP